MANTPNMNLLTPSVGITAGPTYAQNINNDLTIIDSHNHSLGSGVQITPSGLNINADLPLNAHNLTLTNSVQFTPTASLGTANAVYMIGVDFYLNDGSGNVIRLTQGGSVAGATGTITGLPSGTASASFSGSTFTFQSATNTAANLDGGSLILRLSSASSNGLTLSPPNALSGGNYALFLPTIPAQTNVMTLDTSGNMGSTTYDSIGQSMTSVGANAIANSRTRSLGNPAGLGGVAEGFTITGSTSSLTPVLQNGGLILSSSGRPTMVWLTNITNATTPGFLEITNPFGVVASVHVQIVESNLVIADHEIYSPLPKIRLPLSSINTLGNRTGYSGALTYNIYLYVDNASLTVSLVNANLIAYEL